MGRVVDVKQKGVVTDNFRNGPMFQVSDNTTCRIQICQRLHI